MSFVARGACKNLVHCGLGRGEWGRAGALLQQQQHQGGGGRAEAAWGKQRVQDLAQRLGGSGQLGKFTTGDCCLLITGPGLLLQLCW